MLQFLKRLFTPAYHMQVFPGYDPRRKTEDFEGIGDCLTRDEVTTVYNVDRNLPVRHGDIALICIPSRPGGAQLAAKWFVEVDGQAWIASKYFAVRKSNFQQIIGRVVSRIRVPNASLSNPVESARLKAECLVLRQNPPNRLDVVVFPVDLFDIKDIVAAIRAKQSGHN